MSYMTELEERLHQLLTDVPDGEQAIIIREMKKIALESYRNGQAAGQAAKTQRQIKSGIPAARAKAARAANHYPAITG